MRSFSESLAVSSSTGVCRLSPRPDRSCRSQSTPDPSGRRQSRRITSNGLSAAERAVATVVTQSTA